MGVIIPQQYAADVDAAAKALGLPVAVVAEQIAHESSWDPNARSSAGAEGIAQFEPATWAIYGHGSPYNPTDAFAAYTAYMGALLKQEGGDTRKALAAYNAGPDDLAAGYGYADYILSQAGSNDIHTPGIVGQVVNTVNDVTGGLISWPSDIINFFSNASTALTKSTTFAAAFFQPSTYIRIGAGAFGTVALIAGIVVLGLAAKDT
jgi:hypothetical protein